MTDLNTFERGVVEALNSVSSGIESPDQWLVDALGGGQSSSGVHVTAATILGLPTAYWSINQIAGDIGKLPLEIRRKRPDGGSDVDNTHYAQKVINRPNFFQCGSTFRQTMMVHALIHGNGRAWINRDAMGRPMEMIIVPPGNTYTLLADGTKWHRFTLDQYRYGEERAMVNQYFVPDQDMVHIQGLSYDGVLGLSLRAIAKDVFGIDKAGLDATGNSFRNNGRPGLLLESPPQAFRSEKDATDWLANFNAQHKGVSNEGRVGLIRENMKAHVLPQSSAQSQHLEQREHSRIDIALLFGTHMLLSQSAVYKNLTERQAAYVTNTLSQWFQAWEDEVNRKLLVGRAQQESYFAKFNARELLRGDANSLAQYTGQLRTQGAINGDEVREIHGFNPAGLDDFGNPNTSSGAEDKPEEDEPAEEETNTEEEAQAALRGAFANLMHAQRKRLIRTGANSKDPKKVAGAMLTKQTDALVAAGKPLGITEEAINAYVAKTRDQFGEIMDMGEHAPAALEMMTDENYWNYRIEALTNVES